MPIAVLGLVVDERTVLSAPVWAKVLKFAISVTFYGLTLLPVLNLLPQVRTGRRISNITGGMLLLEFALIVIQTIRGVPSHFNYATPFDTAVFVTMAIGIAVLWGTNIIATWLLFREPSLSSVLTHGLRLGMLTSIIGMAVAFAMTGPNSVQLDALLDGHTLMQIGAHTTNALVDGQTRMIPLLGWNLDGGDLRVAHFVGLHGLQIIPLLALVIERVQLHSATVTERRHLVTIGAMTYFGITAVALWQALRNESIANPSMLTLAVLAVLLFGALGSAAPIILRRDP